MMLRRALLTLIALMTFGLPPALAQETSSTTAGPKPLIMLENDKTTPKKDKETQLAEALNMLHQLPAQSQTGITQEAAKVKDYCSRNLMLSNFYDCSCLSLKFIKERIQAGPDPEFTRLVDKGDYDVCVSPPQIAGYSYKRCYDVIYLEKMTDKQVDNACACVARNMARDYTLKPYRNVRYTDKIFTDNMLTCRDSIVGNQQ